MHRQTHVIEHYCHAASHNVGLLRVPSGLELLVTNQDIVLQHLAEFKTFCQISRKISQFLIVKDEASPKGPNMEDAMGRTTL